MRPHYSARSGTKTGAAIYRGVDAKSAVTRQDPEMVDAAPGLHKCSVCGGHARVVKAPYTDTEVSVRAGVTLVLGTHRAGGKSSRGIASRCAGSLRPL